ncbi:MAG: hypothetical protein LAO09_11875 [Acidobacteriia bacterium]|nr:hypothetical protein [Terriglobia bacterium]
MLKPAGAVLAILLFLTSVSLAQDGHFDASINGAGVFTSQSSGNGITQSATDGLNVFGTFRVRFKSRHSFVFNYGRTKDSQIYEVNNNFHVLTTISEYSGAYVFSPLKKGRFEPFFLAGVGALRFSPRSTWVFFPDLADGTHNRVQIAVGAVKQTQLAFLYGLGVDYRLPVFSRLALRLQYRGFLYNAPDFKVDTSSGNALSFFTGARGHMAEPSVGLVFRF